MSPSASASAASALMSFTSSNSNGAAPAAGKEQRLIVVSNRLPVTISKDAQGVYHFKVSLLFGLSYGNEECGWLGELGTCGSKAVEKRVDLQ